MSEYNPQSLDKKWQAQWTEDRAFEVDADPSRPKFYCLEMFAYPSGIIGVAAVANAFSKDIVRAMSTINKRPIVFALSNPTSKAECTAEQAYRWSDGRAIFACGSPFDPVTLDGRTLVPRQGNNSYIFPGVGLGVITTRATRVTDEMFMAAARALAHQVTQADLDQGSLFPPLVSIREVSAHIAAAVAEVSFRKGFARVPEPADLVSFMKAQMYEPRYESVPAAKQSASAN